MASKTNDTLVVSRRGVVGLAICLTLYESLSPTRTVASILNDPKTPNRGNRPMLDKRVQTYELYLAAWSAIPDQERADMLRESLSLDVIFENPTKSRRGLADMAEHLEGFQVRSPGGSFRMNNMVGWGSGALAEWQLVDGDGNAGFSGYDVLTFDGQGLISRILLFGNVEAQKLAWRRRDPVSLKTTD